MKAWIVLVFKRIGDLIVKLISVKTIPAVIVSVIVLKDATFPNVTLMCLMWAMLVGFRYAEKLMHLVHPDKGE